MEWLHEALTRLAGVVDEGWEAALPAAKAEVVVVHSGGACQQVELPQRRELVGACSRPSLDNCERHMHKQSSY